MATTILNDTVHTTEPIGFLPEPQAENENIFLRRADEALAQEREATEFRRRQFLEQTDKDLLSFDTFQPSEREAVRRQRLIRNVMDAEHDVMPKTSAAYQHARAQISHRMFGEVLDDERFFTKLQERAQTRKTQGEFQQELVTSAVLDAVSGGGLPYQKWNSANSLHAGREKSKDARYIEQWNETQSRIEEQYGDVLPTVRRMYDHLTGENEQDASSFFYELSEEERPLALNLLQMAARGLSEEKKATFFGNLKKQSGRDIKGLGRKVIDGMKFYTLAAGAASGDVGTIAQAQMERSESSFRSDLRDVIEQDYDPVRHLFPEDSKLGSAERAAYIIPGIVASSAMAITPFVGQAAAIFSAEEDAFQRYRKRFMEAGLTEEEAMAQASVLSLPVAVIQGGLERLGGKVILGKFPVLDKTLTKFSDKVTNRATRFGTKTIINAGQETVIENLQDLTLEAVQDITHALNQDVPDVNWNEVFEGYAHQSLTTFMAVLPLSVFGAAGGVSRDRRNRAFSQATELELKAAGYSAESITAIKSADGDASLEQAVTEAQEFIDPRSEEAKEATQELAENIVRQKELEADAMRAGVLPRIRVKADGMEILDPETEQVLGVAESSSEAVQIISDHSRLKEKSESNTLLYLKSMIEGAQLTTQRDGADRSTTVELRLDEQTTVAQAAAESAQNAEQAREQLAIQEQLGGGDGSMTTLVMGQSSTEFEGRQRKTLNRLNGGASILTVVHEDAHGLFREALQTGRLTKEETIEFFRTVDQATGEKARNFLPEGEVSDVALDEAVAEYAEVELLRTRKGENTRNVVNSNLSAIAQQGVTSNKFKSFFTAMKQYFKTALTRHLHIKQALKDGKLDESKLDQFRAKLQGTTLQEEYEGEIIAQAESFLGNQPFSLSETPQVEIEPLGEKFTSHAELKKFVIDTILEKFSGQTITVSESGHNILMPDSRTKAKQASKTRNPKAAEIANSLKSIIEQSLYRGSTQPDGDTQRSKGKNRRFQNATEVHRFHVDVKIGEEVFDTWFTAIEKENGNLDFDSLGLQKKSSGGSELTQENSAPSAHPSDTSINQKAGESNQYSLGTAEIADALIGDVTKRVRNPENRAKILGDIMRRLEGTKRDTDKIINAFGQDYVQKAIVEERTVKSLNKEAAFRQADIRKQLESKGMPPAKARAEASQQAQEWLENTRKEQARDHSPKAKIRRSLATLDAIVMALPSELRGKVGGYTQLAKLNSDEKRLEYLQKKIDKVDVVLERHMKKEFGGMMKKLLKRAEPKQGEAGKGKRGKVGANVHTLFDELKDVMQMKAQEVEARASSYEELLNAKEPLSDADQNHYQLLSSLTPLFGDWKNADASRMESAVRNGLEVYNHGYLNELERTAAKREERQRVRKELSNDTGKAGSAIERDQKKIEDKAIRSLPKKVQFDLLSFGQVLKSAFGINSAEAQKYEDAERSAYNTKQDALNDHFDQFSNLFTQLAGGELEGEKLRWRLSQPSIKTKTVERHLSEAEAIQALMMWRQEDGKRHMQGKFDDDGKQVSEWAYTQEFIDELGDSLSFEAKEVMSYLMDQYASEYDTINPIHEKLYGISMPRNKNYSPITVAPTQSNRDNTPDLEGNAGMAGMTISPGALKTRSRVAIAEPKFTDALQVFMGHKKQMEHWKAYAPLVTEMRATLNHRDVSNKVESAIGKEGLGTLKNWIEIFANGGVREMSAQMESSKWLGRATGRAASSALIGRVSVLAIQATQLGAAQAHMPVASYIKRLGKLLSGQLNWGASIKSEYIQRRVKDAPPIVRQALDSLASAEPNKVKHLVTKMGETISGADALFTAGTYSIIYDYQLSQGLSEKEARANTERLTDEVAQPVRIGTRSLYENTTQGNPAMRLLWAFSSEPRQKLMLTAFAMSKGTAAEKARAIAVTWGYGGAMAAIIRAIMADLRNNDDDEWFDEKHWNPKRIALQTLTGPIQGIPLLGDAIQGGAFKLSGEYLPEGNLLSGMERGAVASKNILTGKSFEDDEKLLRDVDALLSGLALGNDTLAAYSSLSHLAKDLYMGTKNAADIE